MEITKEFIDTFLKIINLQADSKVRSKPNRGIFMIEQVLNDNGELLNSNNHVEFQFNYYQYFQTNQKHTILRKRYNFELYMKDKQSFDSTFYQGVVDACVLGSGKNCVKELTHLGLD